MKRANIGAVLNFDLSDLQKIGQIKNQGIMSCILDLPMIKCGDYPAISSGVIALCCFFKMATWRPYLKSDRAEIW
jgi:hypothetical protein